MKRALPLYLILFFSAVPAVHAAFYQWTDAAGVVHFTDNPKQIPGKYRKKAKKVELSDEPSAVSVQPAPSPAPQAPSPVMRRPMPGGRPEEYWRGRYSAYREQIATAQNRLAQKQGKLTELRRKRTLYHKASDRVAINTTEAEISADEAKLAELLKGFETFDAEAVRAGVPEEWRR